MITNLKRNRLGTTDFTAQFKGMRKAQSFIVYPIKAGDDATQLLVQSDTRIGYIRLDTGIVWMSKPHASGAYSHHLAERAIIDKLTQEDLFSLKAQVFTTAHGDAGRSINRVIGCDNSGALEIFGVTA